MRKLYVIPKDVWLAYVDIFSPQLGSHYIDLVDHTDPTDKPTTHEEIYDAWSQGIDVPNANMILMAASFASEKNEDMWEELGAVAVLPHPTFEGNVPLSDVNLDAADSNSKKKNGKHPHEGKKFRAHHVDALKKHKLLGFDESDTVLDLSRKAALIHPEVRVRGLR